MISDRCKKIDASGIRRIWQLASQMTDPVDFSIGEPDFDVPANLKAAAHEAIDDKYNGYALTAGIPALREGLKKKAIEEFGWKSLDAIVTSGVSGALHLAFMALVNPGDEVLVPDPYFVSYSHLVGLMDGKCVYLNTYPDFQLTADMIENSITDKSKILIINSPANPTGRMLDESLLKKIAQIAQKHDLIIISDEIYWEFSYDSPPVSIANYYEKTLVLRGFSKTYGVPGWRLGYILFPEALLELAERMATLQQYTFVCAAHPFQKAAADALDCDISNEIKSYREKRDLIYDGLKESFNLHKPEGAFYAFVEAPNQKASEFVEKAIQNNVLIIPGSVFSQQDTHFRISFATSNEQIEKGISRLKEIAS